MKRIPNCLSISRIILSLTLLFIQPLSIFFYTVYILCGVSDMLDGYIARKYNVTSALGARLDSIADFIMVVVLLMVLAPVVRPPAYILGWMVLIAVIRFVAILMAKRKYGRFAMLHTLANKGTGLSLFLFPILLILMPISLVMVLVCSMASLSAIEECAIHMTSPALNLDKKSIFVK